MKNSKVFIFGLVACFSVVGWFCYNLDGGSRISFSGTFVLAAALFLAGICFANVAQSISDGDIGQMIDRLTASKSERTYPSQLKAERFPWEDA